MIIKLPGLFIIVILPGPCDTSCGFSVVCETSWDLSMIVKLPGFSL